MSTKYFALIEGYTNKPSGLFREVETGDEYRLEYLSAAGEWTLDYDLSRYIFGGDPGAVEISEDQAKQIWQKFANKKNLSQDSAWTELKKKSGASYEAQDSRQEDQSPYFRKLTKYEQRVEFPAIDDAFAIMTRKADARLRPILEAVQKSTLKRAREAIDNGLSARTAANFQVNTGQSFADAIRDFLYDAWRTGSRQGYSELPDDAKKQVGLIKAFEWDESKHPRDDIGRWTDGEGGDSGKTGGFYSPLQRALEGAKQASAPASNWISIISKSSGVTKDELAATGIVDHLRALGEGSITKDDLLAFAKENAVEIKPVVLGSNGANLEHEDNALELEWGRLNRSLNENPGMASADRMQTVNRMNAISARRAEINDELSQSGATKFGQYTLPGGENYREVLLTLPAKVAEPQTGTELPAGYELIVDKSQPERFQWGVVPPGQEHARPFAGQWASPEEATKAALEAINADAAFKAEVERGKDAFQSAHFDTPNIVAHLRMDDRVDADGNKVLFLEEIQSDWAQKGRSEGFAKDTTGWTAQRLNDPDAGFSHWQIKDADGNDVTKIVGGTPESAIAKAAEGIPSAPFVTDTKAWVGLAMNHALDEAVKGGYSAVAWTTGEQQAERYDLSKQVKNISYIPVASGFTIMASPLNGGAAIDLGTHAPDKLSEVVGKDLAAKIIKGEGEDYHGVKSLSGGDLRVGGEGMKSFYDKIVPQVTSKLIKRSDPEAKIDKIKMAFKELQGPYLVDGSLRPHEQQGVYLTKKMREQIRKGVALFSTEQDALEYADWDESLHPRDNDGKFTESGGGQTNTDTPAFKEWFKNSKVVDSSGKPLVVYHGTNVDITKFDPKFSAQGVFWFTSDVNKLNAGESGAASNKVIMPVYLSAQKLAGWDEYEKYSLDEIHHMGFDGIKLDDDYIVFDPNQIKSKFNKGTFDPKDKRISYARDYADWNEEDHPRDDAGRWTDKEGGNEPIQPRKEFLGEYPATGDWNSPESVAYRNREKQWTDMVRTRLSNGQMTQEEARKLGYTENEGQWLPLPDELYHVTVAGDAVDKSGLTPKSTRSDEDVTGLGGGNRDTISLTERPDFAEGIYRGILEAREVALGNVTMNDLWEKAKLGNQGSRPFARELGGHYAGDVEGWKLSDPLPVNLRRNLEGVEFIGSYERNKELKAEGKSGLKAIMLMDRTEMPANAVPVGNPIEGGDGVMRYIGYERPMTKQERYDATAEMFKRWSTWREQAGGPYNPLIFGDFDKLANVKASDIRILKLKPKPGAQGVTNPGMRQAEGEWRIYKGNTVDIVGRDTKSVKLFAGFEPRQALDYLGQKALMIKGLFDEELTGDAQNLLMEHLKGGRTLNETIMDLRELFEPWIGDPEKIGPSGQVGIGFPPGEKAPENILMAYRLENMIRTPLNEAYNQGRLTIGDAAEDYVLGYQYSAILDNRTTEICQENDGLVMRKDDPRTVKLTPPVHYQCRSILVFVTQDDTPVEWSSDEELDAAVERIADGFS